MSKERLSAFVFGGSGAVGQGIVKALAKDARYSKVILFGRRILELPPSSSGENYEKFKQKVLDFSKFSEIGTEPFMGLDVGFYALGVSSSSTDEKTYRLVEHDYATTIANFAQKAGTIHFHYVSGQGTSKNSIFLYAKVKAQVEEEICEMGFKRVSIYRPSAILTSVSSGGQLGATMVKTFRFLDRWNFMSVEADLLGKVIVNNSFSEKGAEREIFENSEINRIGKNIAQSEY